MVRVLHLDDRSLLECSELADGIIYEDQSPVWPYEEVVFEEKWVEPLNYRRFSGGRPAKLKEP